MGNIATSHLFSLAHGCDARSSASLGLTTQAESLTEAKFQVVHRFVNSEPSWSEATETALLSKAAKTLSALSNLTELRASIESLAGAAEIESSNHLLTGLESQRIATSSTGDSLPLVSSTSALLFVAFNLL